MPALSKQIFADFDHLTFARGETFVWSPNQQAIHYVPQALNQPRGIWSLLHEIGHAELAHTSYNDDFQLLIMEVEAWAKAKQIAANYEIDIDEEHIEQCLDSYRDWLHRRSRCLDCGVNSFQLDATTYSCHNCGCKWRVPASKICQVRRQRIVN